MKAQIFAVIAVGSVGLLAACSGLPNTHSSTSTTDQKSATELNQSANKTSEEMAANPSSDEAETMTKTTAKSDLLTTIDVQLTGDQISLDATQADAGPVSFAIRNTSHQPLDFVLLKTDLPTDQIPTKSGKVDLTNTAVKQVGQLVTSPMPANGDETITRTLTPGNYVLMAYRPEHIQTAMTQVITIKAAGI